MDGSADQVETLAMLRESVSEVLAAECGSLAVHAFVDGKNDLAASLWRRASELGWLAIALPETLGGFDLGQRGAGLLHTELGRVVAPGAYIATLAAADVLAAHGDADMCASLLPRIAGGEMRIAVAAQLARGAAVRRGGGDTVEPVRLLGDAGSQMALIPVSARALGLFDLAAIPGTDIDVWDRTRTVFDVDLHGLEPSSIIENEGDAVRTLVSSASIAIAADSIGIGRGVLDKTIAYLKEREQFGRPIGSFQALKHRVVDLVAKIGIAEHVLHQALAATAAREDAADMWAALAKVTCSEAAAFVCGDCVQLFGGVGYTWEYDVHLYLKRARLNEVLVGTNRQMTDAAAEDCARETLAGRSVLELATS